MNGVSFGDLAQTFSLQRRGAELKAEMTRLNEELVTGQVSDVKSILAGNVSYLADLEYDMRALDGYGVVTAEATQFTDAMQLALGRIQDATTQFSQDMLVVADQAVEPVSDQFGTDARAELQSIVSALNTTVAGRTVFSGTATNRAAIAEADDILAGLETAIAAAGATSIDDIFSAAEAWFADPAGYSATVYGGSDTSLNPFRVGEGETVSVPYTADDPAIRDVIKGVALSALVDSGALGLSPDAKRTFLNRTGTDLLSAQSGLSAVRADVGASQERIDEVGSRNAAERVSLEYAKGAFLSADPYETATKLEEVQFQLQSLYTVTARMSDLSLVNFVR